MATEPPESNMFDQIPQWSTCNVITFNAHPNNEVLGRILVSRDGTTLLVDIRRHLNGRPTTEGVALFSHEVEWLHKMFKKRCEGSYEGKRKVYLTRIWSGIRITLVKANGNTKDIVFTGPEYNHFPFTIERLHVMMKEYENKHGPSKKDDTMPVTCEGVPWYEGESLDDNITSSTQNT